MSHLQRRGFIALLGGAASWPIAAHAHQPKMPKIGFLRRATSRGLTARLCAFNQGLAECGYVEGRDVEIEYHCADYNSMALSDLVQAQPTVIVTDCGSGAEVVSRLVTTSTPIVSLLGGDPVKRGLVATLARPGGNITGVMTLKVKTVQEEFQELVELVPNADALALLIHKNNPDIETYSRDVHAAAKTLNRRIDIHKVNKSEGKLNAAFATRESLVAIATHDALPTIYREFITSGGVISYGPRVYEALRQMGSYVGRILNGENVGELPIRRFIDVTVITSLKAASRLGLDIPPTLHALGDG